MAKTSYNDYVKRISSIGNPSASFLNSPLGKLTAMGTQQGQFSALANFGRKPTFGNAVTGAATYALNANPYYAGLNMLTRGALDKNVGKGLSWVGKRLGLGGSRPKPVQDTGLANQQAEYARLANMRGNELMKAYGRFSQEEEEAQKQAEAYRMSGLNLAREGLSARDMAGPMAMLMNPSLEARDAALANTQADLVRRGISSGGIAAGTRAAIEGAVASGAATARGTLAQNAAERAQSMQDSMLAADTARQNQLRQAGLTALSSATDAATNLEQLRLRQREIDAEEAARKREYDLAKFEAIGNIAGLYGPDLIRWAKGLGKRGEGAGTTAGMTGSDGMPVVSLDDGTQVYADSGMPVDPLAFEYQSPPGPVAPIDMDTTQYPQGDQSLVRGEEFWSAFPAMMSLPSTYGPSGRIRSTALPGFNTPVEFATAFRLDQQFPGTRLGQIVQDPRTGLQFIKALDGWRKR